MNSGSRHVYLYARFHITMIQTSHIIACVLIGVLFICTNMRIINKTFIALGTFNCTIINYLIYITMIWKSNIMLCKMYVRALQENIIYIVYNYLVAFLFKYTLFADIDVISFTIVDIGEYLEVLSP